MTYSVKYGTILAHISPEKITSRQESSEHKGKVILTLNNVSIFKRESVILRGVNLSITKGEHAVSVGTMILTTEVLVTDIPDKSAGSMPPMGGMGGHGMDGMM